WSADVCSSDLGMRERDIIKERWRGSGEGGAARREAQHTLMLGGGTGVYYLFNLSAAHLRLIRDWGDATDTPSNQAGGSNTLDSKLVCVFWLVVCVCCLCVCECVMLCVREVTEKESVTEAVKPWGCF